MSEPMSICILGASLPNGNMGVQALAASLVTLFERVAPGCRIRLLFGGSDVAPEQAVFVGGRMKAVSIVTYRMSPRAGWRRHMLVALAAAGLYRIIPLREPRRRLTAALPLLDALARSDLVGDIHGGDSFSDIYGVRLFMASTLPCLLALLMGRRLVLLPQTYGPFRSRPARALAGFIVRRASDVMARDRESLAFARTLDRARANDAHVRFCPDVAFCLEPSMPGAPAIAPPLPAEAGRRLIGLNVSGLLYHGGYTRDNMFALKDGYPEIVLAVARKLLEAPDVSLLLVPHMVKFDEWKIESDYHAARALREALDTDLRRRVHLVEGPYDQHQFKALIGRCACFVGSRMHACIAALSQGIPAIGIAYSRKFEGVFGELGLGANVIDARAHDARAIAAAVADRLAGADAQRTALAAAAADTRRSIVEAFRRLAP